jgi:molybdate transport system substrate-binding protein
MGRRMGVMDSAQTRSSPKAERIPHMKKILLLIASLVLTVPLSSQELIAAAAADLRPALDAIAAKFQAESGIKLRASFGSSGNFFQQLQNGAPFDVFLSANTDYPKRLEASGLVAPNSYYEFARGSIVLLLPNSAPDPGRGLGVLLNPEIRKVAIADPSHAPYGQAAVAALKKEGLYAQVSTKLVTAENISQAASFVLSGAADAGIVAKSLALTPAAREKTKFVSIPREDYPAILQAMVIMAASKNQVAAMNFRSFMRTDVAKEILKQYGFETPGP